MIIIVLLFFVLILYFHVNLSIFWLISILPEYFYLFIFQFLILLYFQALPDHYLI